MEIYKNDEAFNFETVGEGMETQYSDGRMTLENDKQAEEIKALRSCLYEIAKFSKGEYYYNSVQYCLIKHGIKDINDKLNPLLVVDDK